MRQTKIRKFLLLRKYLVIKLLTFFSLIIISENIKISMLQKDKATNEFIK